MSHFTKIPLIEQSQTAEEVDDADGTEQNELRLKQRGEQEKNGILENYHYPSLLFQQTTIQRLMFEHIKQKTINLIKFGGFRISNQFLTTFIFVWLSANLIVDAVTITQNVYCLPLNLCVVSLQLNSLVLYIAAFVCVSNDFIDQVVVALASVDIHCPSFKECVQRHVTMSMVDSDNGNDAETSMSVSVSESDMDPIIVIVPTSVRSPARVQIQRDAAHVSSINENVLDRYSRLSSIGSYASANKNMSLNANMRGMQTVAEKVFADFKQTQQQRSYRMLVYEILKTLAVILPSYLSGYMIFTIAEKDQFWWHLYVVISNVMDFIRYMPLMLHIALVRAFYATFPVNIERLRRKFAIIQTKSDFKKYQITYDKYIINCDHRRFVYECETIFRPYRIFGGYLSAWITIYLAVIVLSFVLFLVSVVNALLKRDCYLAPVTTYYLHYLIELTTFFTGWVFLVWPYCANHVLLERFVSDVKHMPNTNSIEKCAIDEYLQSILQLSPFAIFGTKPTYTKFLNILYLVFFTIGIDVVSRIYGVSF